ncbi:MAG: hypothetical protein D6746_03025 [Bacteroidetes bacterium]|nr:MAG: hypothetical protein D6746_03025 [Bacteroidota bacterium]
MALHLERPHHRTRKEARDHVDALAGELAASLGLRHHWEGDRLVFKGTGVSGHIDIDETHLRAVVRRSPFLPLSERRLRDLIEARLDEHFPPTEPPAAANRPAPSGQGARTDTESPPDASAPPPGAPRTPPDAPLAQALTSLTRHAIHVAGAASSASLRMARRFLDPPGDDART